MSAGVDQVSERIGVRDWKRQARNKDEWQKILRKERAQPGLSSRLLLLLSSSSSLSLL
jgi:hypothetical protein